MHPIERLRAVARASAIPPEVAVRETAQALVSVAGDPHALVTAARRMIERHPTMAPMWWFAARVLTAADPRAEARRCVEAMQADATARELSYAISDGAVITVVGWPEATARALARRGDLEVRVVDALGDGARLADRLLDHDVDAVDVAPEAVAASVVNSDLVVLEADAFGPTSTLCTVGSRAAAAVAQHAGVPVWMTLGVGHALCVEIWDALYERADLNQEPWFATLEAVPHDLVDQVASNGGLESVPDALQGVDCPVAPELLA